jgi:cyanophycin synthetase
MEFLRTLPLRGPNIWARFPVLEIWVDLKDLKDAASSEIPGFNDRLQAFLPSLIEHHCSEGARGGFLARLERGTYLAHILEHVVLELQCQAGSLVTFGKTRLTGVDGVYKMVVRYHDEEMAREAAEAGRQLVLAAVHDRPFDVAGAVQRLKDILAKNRPSPVTEALLKAAKERRVPAKVLDGGNLVQLGWGSHQRRVLDGQTDASSAVANGIAYDRVLSRQMLQSVGVPVPQGRCVSSADDAWAAAQEVDMPVVLRPKYVSGKDEVVGPLHNHVEIEAAYREVAASGRSYLIEGHIPGEEYRLLVIGSKVAAVAKREAQGFADVTERLHPVIAEQAVDAASVVGLDVAGVEVVARDIARPLEEQHGAIVSIIGQPDFSIHLHPIAGTPQPVALALVDHLYEDPRDSRIPIVAVTGTNGKTTTTRLTAHLLGRTHKPVGMTCTEGIYIGERRVAKGDCSGPKSAKVILQHTEPGAAVLETARGGILREGLGFDRCDVAIVTNIGEGDHLGLSDIDTPEQLAYVKSTIVWAVKDTGYAVLNANDPLVVNMAAWCPGKIIFFARDEAHPVIVGHLEKGGRAVFVRNNAIILSEGAQETLLETLDKVPLTHGGKVGFHVENALASAAAAWALGVPTEDIRAGLETFNPGMDKVPARFNLLDIGGVTVVLDYGHNTSALVKLLEVLDLFPHKHRSCVYSAAGDRRDSDIVDQGEVLGRCFDRIILYEDAYLRGRKEGEISGLFQQGIAKGGRASDIRTIKGGMLAIEIALAACSPGDLLFVQPDLIDDGVQLLKKFLGAGGREIRLEEALRPKAAPEAAASGAGVEVHEGRLGKAAVAARAFRQGDVILKGYGPTTKQRSMHTIQVDRHLHIIPPSPMRFLNHSCEPNCGLLIRSGVREVEVHALRDIEPGEELTLDYETFEETFEALTGPCLCQTLGCRGSLQGYKALPKDRREYFGIYVAEHLRKSAETPVLVPVAAEKEKKKLSLAAAK